MSSVSETPAPGAGERAKEPATGPRPPAPSGEEPPAGAGTDWQIVPSGVQYEPVLIVCLSKLAGLLGRPISTDALAAGLPQDDMTRPDLVVRAAERAGLRAAVMRKPRLEDIPQLALPCVLLLKGGNACVLLRHDATGPRVIMGETPEHEQTPTAAELQEAYAGYAIFAQAEARLDVRSADIRLSQPKSWFWGTLRQFLPIYKHVILASVAVNLFAIASPLFTMNVYDRVVPNNAIETLWVLALGVGIVFLFDFLLRNLRSYFVDIAGKNADVIMGSRLFGQVLGLRLDRRPRSSGSMANGVREFDSLREFFSSSSLLALVDLPFVFIFVAIVWLVGGPLALVPLIAIPVVVGVGFVLQYPLRRVIEKTYRESAQKHALLVEAINGLEIIKAAGAEGQVQREYERLLGRTATSSGQARTISTLSTTFAALATHVVYVAVVIWGVYEIAEGNLTMGALIASAILTGRAMAPLAMVASMMTRLQQSRIALKNLDALMDSPVERPTDKAFVSCPSGTPTIEFRRVSFRYPGNQMKALDDLSLKVAPGERVGFIGRIGSGKTTLSRMLLGLYEPQEGAVTFDGSDIRQIDPADLRRRIGYASQDNTLFFGTVRENIYFGAPFVDENALLRAAQVAGVSDFVRNHPLGFDMPCGERGSNLSGGQRQAVALARALLLDPPILILDEPTSAMDNSTEAAFRSRLEAILPGKTLILVTHRTSLLSLVDRLVIVEGGKIVADGKKDEVIEALRKGQIRGGVA